MKYKVKLEYGITYELTVEADNEGEAEAEAVSEAEEMIARGNVNLRTAQVEEVAN